MQLNYSVVKMVRYKRVTAFSNFSHCMSYSVCLNYVVWFLVLFLHLFKTNATKSWCVPVVIMTAMIVLLQLSDFIEGLTQVTYSSHLCLSTCLLLYLWLVSNFSVYFVFFLARLCCLHWYVLCPDLDTYGYVCVTHTFISNFVVVYRCMLSMRDP